MRLFISYSHRDLNFVRRLSEDLRHYGYEVWLDEREIQVGQSIARSIRKGIERSDFFLLVISEPSNQSTWVQHELDAALQAEIRGELRGVLPLLREQAKLPSLLDGRLYADFTGRRYQRPFNLLLKALGHDLDSICVMASFISKKRRLARLVPHLIDTFGFSKVATWEPVDLHVEITAGYLSYLRDSSVKGAGFRYQSPPSPLILDPEVPPLAKAHLQIGFGHMRAHLIQGADVHVHGGATYEVPNWKSTIHIAGLSPEVEKIVIHLADCEYLGDEVRQDVAEIAQWWKRSQLPHRHTVRVSGAYFQRDVIVKTYDD
jgi:TIR domain